MTMKAQVLDYTPAAHRRALGRQSRADEQAATAFDDMTDGILALDFALTLASFGYEARQLVLSIVGLLGGGDSAVEAFDEELAKHLKCSDRTVRRWRAAHIKESKAKKFSLLYLEEGEYNAERKRYEKTAYSLNPAVAVYVNAVVAEARASDLYRSDRRAAIKRAAEEHYADIPDAPPRSRKKSPYRSPAVKVGQAFVNAARSVEKGKRELEHLDESVRAALLEGKQGAELRATLLKLQADIAEVLQDFPQSSEDEELEGGIGQNVRYPLVGDQGEPSAAHVAAFDHICERAAGEPRVRSRKIALRDTGPPPEDVPDETEVCEQIAVLVEAGVLDEESARGFEELSHDPLTREVFARRYMRGSQIREGVT